MSSKASVSKADAVLKQALDLSPGDVTYVRCSDRGEMESMRTLLFMSRRRMLTTDPGIDSKVRISRHNQDGLFAVKISRMNEMDDSIVIIRKDGTTEHKRVVVTPRDIILTRFDEMVRQGLSLQAIKDSRYKLFLPALFPDTNEIDKAIEWLSQEQSAGRMLTFVLPEKTECEEVKTLPTEELIPPREEILTRIEVDVDEGFTLDEIEERLKDKFPLEFENAMKWVRSVGIDAINLSE